MIDANDYGGGGVREDGKRTPLERDHLADLTILNRELERLGIPALLSIEAARICPPAELEHVAVTTRRYLLQRARELGEVI
jgi:hypothetical protein